MLNFRKLCPTVFLAAVMAFGLAVSGAQAEDQNTAGTYAAIRGGFNDLRPSNLVGSGVNSEAKFDNGTVLGLAIGHAYGNGWRMEAEVTRRDNDVKSVSGASGTGDVTTHALMLNGYYDFPAIGRVTPYLGLGAGYAHIDADASPVGGSRIDDSDGTFAWQAIAGLALPLSNALDLTADLRMFTAQDPSFSLASGGSVDGEYRDTSFLIGLRWRFGAPAPRRAMEAAVVAPPAPKPMPAPKAAAAPQPKPLPRSFIIFFDWDKANIQPDAQKILEAAAAAAKQGNRVRIELTGHADRSGMPRYNMGLSLRRANAAKAMLVKLGLDPQGVSVAGKGESQPLVSTADGVREARNRRVEIIF
ncbi:MAG: OOP family OmpA-OmpF porin [Alphaproteobacteria bacterium]|jgi:OOP family OmpA-OmpF porin